MAAAAKMGGGMKLAAVFMMLACGGYGATWHVIAGGLGGEPEYEQRFTALTKDLSKYVAGADVAVSELSGSAATKQALKAAIDKAAAALAPKDVLVLTLIGHGTFDGAEYKFNVPGPDVTSRELAAWLEPVKAQQVVVLATSASGGAIDALKRPGRVLITATRSGMERNAVVFPRYWVEAFRDAGADTDKNQTVSAMEAYRYADKKSTEFYETQKRLATEHPMLEDTGMAEAARAPSPENKQGLLAAQIAVARFGATQEALRDPAKQKLLARREEIEQSIDKLKYEKAAMPSDEYRKELSALLLELARLQEELEK